jgi:hypothetical protein
LLEFLFFLHFCFVSSDMAHLCLCTTDLSYLV